MSESKEPRRIAALARIGTGYILLLALLLAPSLALLSSASDRSHSTAVLTQAALLLLLAALAVGRWRRLLWWALVPVLLVPIETFFVLQYGYPSTRHVLALISETNAGEAAEFFSGLWLPLSAATCAALAAWLALRFWVPDHRVARWGVSMASLGALAVLLVVPEVARRIDTAPLALRQFSWADAYPVGLAFRVAGFVRAQLATSEARAAIAAFDWGATTDVDRMTVVVVVGESSRPDHWQLGGYARETTPRLSARSDVVFLHDLVSPWTLTRYSVPTFLKRKAATQAAVLPEKSIIAAFRQAGYETFWFANQEGLDEVTMLASEAEHRRSFNLAVGRGDIDAAYDGAMLPAVQQALRSASPRKLIVLHTKGSHWDFQLRYPDAFRHFTPDRTAAGESGKYDPRNRDLLVNAYDNSIRYTDYLLAELISDLQTAGGPAALIYASDHGLGLYDHGCKIFGQGNDLEASYRTAGMIWLSPTWRQLHPDGAAALGRNAKLPLTTAGTIFHTVAQLGGLNITDESKSLVSAEFRPRPRPVNTIPAGSTDFDRSARIGNCRLVEPMRTATQAPP